MTITITPWDTASFTSETVALKAEIAYNPSEAYLVNYHSLRVRIEDISEIRHRLIDNKVEVHYESGLQFTLDATTTTIIIEGETMADNQHLEDTLAKIAFGNQYIAP